ncbi:hypothetical protein D9M71_660060 [compost metagenome]
MSAVSRAKRGHRLAAIASRSRLRGDSPRLRASRNRISAAVYSGYTSKPTITLMPGKLSGSVEWSTTCCSSASSITSGRHSCTIWPRLRLKKYSESRSTSNGFISWYRRLEAVAHFNRSSAGGRKRKRSVNVIETSCFSLH